MRSDARKRLEATLKSPPPVVIRKVGGDWHAECDDECTDPLLLWTGSHHDAYETAIGHALLHHGRRP